MRFCVKCGKDYDDSDTARECFNRVEGERCWGFISNKPQGPDCLVCEDKGEVKIEGESIPCHRGCGKQRRLHD